MLGSELWESNFNGLLGLVKECNYCRCVGNMKTSIYNYNNDNNTQMVAAALGPWASHSEDRAEP